MEGPTSNKLIERTGLKQRKNVLASLMRSQGVPMLLYGDQMPPHASRQ